MSAAFYPHASGVAFQQCLPDMIEAIGGDRFGMKLLAFLHESCGAEHCTLLRLDSDHLSTVIAQSLDGTDTALRQVTTYIRDNYWQRDPMMEQARRRLLHSESSIIVHMEIAEFPDSVFRDTIYGCTNIRDRLLLCHRSPQGATCLSVLRTGFFDADEIDRINCAAPLLLAILNKHGSRRCRSASMRELLTSLRIIESNIATAATALPRREAQVCARILYGMSSIGISLDLGIGEESVTTYRKRAYQRLGIGSQRELLLWYLSICTPCLQLDVSACPSPAQRWTN